MVQPPQEITKSSKRRVASVVYDRLRNLILDGRLAPGQRLIETDLLEDFDVSRNTLREALFRLHENGLVEMKHQRGASVARFSKQRMQEIFVLREKLEGFAAELAAYNVDRPGNREWLQAQRKLWMGSDVYSSDYEHIKRNGPFHSGIHRMADNERLVMIIEGLQIPAYKRDAERALTPDDTRQSVSEHLGIINAMLDGDADMASHLMSKHIRRAAEIASRIAD